MIGLGSVGLTSVALPEISGGGGGGGGPSISTTSSATPANGSLLTITGTAFGTAWGEVSIAGALQEIRTWADTSIVILVSRGESKYGVGVNLVVTDNAAAASTPYALTSLQPQPGWAYIDLTSIAGTGVIDAIPILAIGDQVAYDTIGGDVAVAADGTFSTENTVTSFEVEAWTPDGGWSVVARQSFPLSVHLWDTSVQIGNDVWLRNPLETAAGGPHATTGALLSGAAVVAGSAAHLTLHTTTGALVSGAATLAGVALHPHTSTGSLVVGSATIAGTALHPRVATGALVVGSATIAGVALHPRAATGSLVVGSATIAGAADRSTAAGHATTGDLAATSATIAGAAAHLTLHATSGSLVVGSATVAGAALHPHTTTGALAAQSATVSGAAAHLHATSGALLSQAATIAGTATHAASGTHPTSGALAVGDAVISGNADHISLTTPGAGGDAPARPGGLLHLHKLAQAFKDKQEREEAIQKLPKATEQERVVLRKSARKLIEREPINYRELEARVAEDLAQVGLKPEPHHLDWLLFLLRVEAYATQQQAMQAEEEAAVVALTLWMMEN